MESESNEKILKILDVNIEYHEKSKSYKFIPLYSLAIGICPLFFSLLLKILKNEISFNISEIFFYIAIFSNVSVSVFYFINRIFRSKSMLNLYFGNYDKFTKKSHLCGHVWDLISCIIRTIANAIVVLNNLDSMNIIVVVFSIFLVKSLMLVVRKIRIMMRDYIYKNNQTIDLNEIQKNMDVITLFRNQIVIWVILSDTIFIPIFIYILIMRYSINQLISVEIAALFSCIDLIFDFSTLKMADKMRLDWLIKMKKDVQLGKNISDEIKNIILHEEFNNFNTNIFTCDD